MPPWVSRKRGRSPSPAPAPPSKAAKRPTKKAKATLFDAVDAPTKQQNTVEENKKLLAELNDTDDDNESLSEADSDDFEDVPAAKRRKTAAAKEEDEEDSEDEMEWEDAISAQPTPGPSKAPPEREYGDVSITLKDDGAIVDPGITNTSSGKKGPSKREKWSRMQAHCLHVQSLMWHNTIRNSWLNDAEVQRTLVDGLTDGVKREVTRWKEAMGTLSKDELTARKKAAMTAKTKGKKGKKQGGRDWNYDAEHADVGVPNISAGDPLLRLLKVLTSYWRKRFTITAPGSRKQGHMGVKRLRDEVKAWEQNKSDAEEYGERIESLLQFRKLAKGCEGSRDVGAQLFAALLRGLGLETRMVASLQPVGFGFTKVEEANAKKTKSKAAAKVEVASDSDVVEVKPKKASSSKKAKAAPTKEKPRRKSERGNKAAPISLDDSESELSDAPSEMETAPADGDDDDDDISVIDVTPANLKKKPNKKYDRDLAFPHYWVEVCSPATHKYIPIDPLVLATIGSNEEHLQKFEPRGKKAEVGKQVMAYTIAFSSDGTAKDVTVRYLKNHQLPGKTKGMRVAAEKVPIYNRKGKVKRYEEYDWFRSVMAGYERRGPKRTAADDLEEQTDLVPRQAEKKEGKEVEKESLQWYKQSAEFVLEQHLRREEALVPDAKIVRMFTAKGKKGGKEEEVPVYRRQDVVPCKTVESWHKEGRALLEGQHPMKLVPMRAVTLIRKREMEDALRETGEKAKQGLYSRDQTDWIIPPPIQNGKIPKNAYGNMDVYVPTMVPEGAVHVPLKGCAKLCRKLEIDYAEACTGFEFGKQRAVPVITGVVVAEEHEMLVRDAWREEQKEVKRKEDTKRTAAALHWWRKMLLGLRVLDRMKADYAESGARGEDVNPFVAKAKREGRSTAVAEPAVTGVEEDEMGGGFFLPGHDEEEVPQQQRAKAAAAAAADDDEMAGGGFLAESDEEDHAPEPEDDGLLVEQHADEVKQPPKGQTPVTPVSLQSLHKGTNGADDDIDDVVMQDIDDAALPEPLPVRMSGKAKARPGRKIVAKVSDDSEAASCLSSVSDASEDEGVAVEPASDSDSDDVVLSRKRRVPSSPRVVVSAAKNSRNNPAKPRARAAKKSTPLKSQYFAASDDEDGGEDHAGEDEESEMEIVRPRRTTARTRRP